MTTNNIFYVIGQLMEKHSSSSPDTFENTKLLYCVYIYIFEKQKRTSMNQFVDYFRYCCFYTADRGYILN